MKTSIHPGGRNRFDLRFANGFQRLR